MRAMVGIRIQLRSLAVSMLKEIDEAIAESNLASELTARAQEAKKEADALNRAAHSINDIASVASKITGVVTGIAGLPFL